MVRRFFFFLSFLKCYLNSFWAEFFFFFTVFTSTRNHNDSNKLVQQKVEIYRKMMFNFGLLRLYDAFCGHFSIWLLTSNLSLSRLFNKSLSHLWSTSIVAHWDRCHNCFWLQFELIINFQYIDSIFFLSSLSRNHGRKSRNWKCVFFYSNRLFVAFFV